MVPSCIRTRARSSTRSWGPYRAYSPTSHRSGTPNSSATRSWSRQHVAVPDRRTATVPLQTLERLQLALPDCRLRGPSLAWRPGRLATTVVSCLRRSTSRLVGNHLFAGPRRSVPMSSLTLRAFRRATTSLGNVGPDEPFGGGVTGVDFPAADPATTGQIMQFRVVPATVADPTTPSSGF